MENILLSSGFQAYVAIAISFHRSLMGHANHIPKIVQNVLIKPRLTIAPPIPLILTNVILQVL